MVPLILMGLIVPSEKCSGGSIFPVVLGIADVIDEKRAKWVSRVVFS